MIEVAVEEYVSVSRERVSRDAGVAELFDRHYDGLCNLAFVIMRDRYLAEEIVMEALVKTFSGWGRIREQDRAHLYLRRAVVNLCRSKIRRAVLERRVNASEHAIQQRAAPDWTPEIHETARELWEAVNKLPVRQRACVVLRYQEDLPEADIAAILDCSPSTVRSQLTRARVKLNRMLGSIEDEPKERNGA